MEQVAVRILLVEDNPADAHMLRLLLGGDDPAFEIAHVETLEQARRFLQEKSCQAVLLDLSLPDSTGLQTLADALAFAPDVPILVLTGLEDRSVGMEAVHRGAQDFLNKGHVDKALLVRAIGYAIERKGSELALRRARDELEQRVSERTAELQQRAGQLARLASELTLAEQRERQRLATVLHDHLQQLLVGMKFGLEVLARRMGDPNRSAVEQVQGLLDEAIKASRSLTAELSPPILHEGGLTAGLDWLARWMGEKHGLTVELKLDGDAQPQREDVRVLLFQSVRELLFNVVKHAGVTRARVELARQNRNHVRVTVSDEGKGFGDGQTVQPGGTLLVGGFGLFSIRERLHMLGGCLDIATGPGAGTIITLLAPCRLDVDVSTEPAAQTARQAGALATVPESRLAGKISILLVDDHAIMREGLRQMLESEADLAVVGQAGDGLEAIESARRLRPDVILMDCSMPRMDGVEATRILRAEQPDIRIIGLSMYEEADRASAMIDAGAVYYLTKSGSPDLLLSAIRHKGAPHIGAER